MSNSRVVGMFSAVTLSFCSLFACSIGMERLPTIPFDGQSMVPEGIVLEVVLPDKPRPDAPAYDGAVELRHDGELVEVSVELSSDQDRLLITPTVPLSPGEYSLFSRPGDFDSGEGHWVSPDGLFRGVDTVASALFTVGSSPMIIGGFVDPEDGVRYFVFSEPVGTLGRFSDRDGEGLSLIPGPIPQIWLVDDESRAGRRYRGEVPLVEEPFFAESGGEFVLPEEWDEGEVAIGFFLGDAGSER